MITTAQPGASLAAVCRSLRGPGAVSLVLDGGPPPIGWRPGPLVALAARVVEREPEGAPVTAVREALGRVDARWRARRGRGGGPGTGLALLLSYEALDPEGSSSPDPLEVPRLLAIEVEESLCWTGPDRIEYATSGGVVRAGDGAGHLSGSLTPAGRAARVRGRPTSSLPRGRYRRATERLLDHIRDGDVYQANLCRAWHGPYAGDELECYGRLAAATPAPRAAFLATEELAVASASPEIFLTLDPPDRIETWPIKGTRARGETREADRDAAASLLRSEKDRAELLMIVDLERNDLGRVCKTGSIEVPAVAELRTFPAVHHLVARVRGRLRSEVTLPEIVEATFPGGSITGAPKERARRLLSGLEPVGRGYFTGSLLWLADDGGLDSSILIRTIVFRNGRFHLGAGGGIVADSTPDLEWHESGHKARALAGILGFEPEDVG